LVRWNTRAKFGPKATAVGETEHKGWVWAEGDEVLVFWVCVYVCAWWFSSLDRSLRIKVNY
jgi:hypothetical protein